MKHILTFVILTSTMLLLSSCDDISKNKVALAQDQFIEKQVIFFTDERNVSQEIPYYDAIIELKSRYPDHFKKLKVVSLNSEATTEIADTPPTSPAIVVVENNQIICKVEGHTSKENIIQPVTRAIKSW
ncbi:MULTISPECIES: small peptidoglycan-associated lipoprotein [Bacillaceae]|uniref:small peptidoglycan-associated lipoprotein n=1 Tax=Bacillaceae TaxID=186817 RepID=UPI001C5708EB|nr:small peptidoglycan-associated lipoprotein [Rossellomorea sp. YZS02]MBW3114031.1 small peptidoglycan-associated lipoprotein [Bacillus sp. MCCB 382]MDX8342938.1 small peptidoglycan-associated lipoprotein [Rossellomorea sp. YZS02]